MGRAVRQDLEDSIRGQVRELFRTVASLLEALPENSRAALSDVRALRALDLVADGLPAGQLGAHLGLSSGATTALLDRLEAAGLVVRERDPADRRRVLVRLTPAARRSAGAQLTAIDERLTAALAASSDGDLAAVTRFLTRLAGQDDAAAGAPSAG